MPGCFSQTCSENIFKMIFQRNLCINILFGFSSKREKWLENSSMQERFGKFKYAMEMARARHFKSDEQDFSPVCLPFGVPSWRSRMKTHFPPSATPSLFSSFVLVRSVDFQVRVVVLPRSHSRRGFDELQSAALSCSKI
jgi:hypothetical protein